MQKKKRLYSKAQVEFGASTYRWIVMIILALLLGFFLFMMIRRWSGAFQP